MTPSLVPLTQDDHDKLNYWIWTLTKHTRKPQGPEFNREMNKRAIRAGFRVSRERLLKYYKERRYKIRSYSLKRGWMTKERIDKFEED